MKPARIAGATAALCLVLGQLAAAAQVMPVLQITATVVSGADSRVANAGGWDNKTCASVMHTVNVTRPPAHGAVTVHDEDTTIPVRAQRSGPTGPCVGRPLKDKMIVYKSSPGFVGTDTFSYESVYPDGKRAPYNVTITVRAANAGGRPPAPAPANIYRMVIQAPPEVGGKCIDVPWAQFIAGMRIQMWDCNNGAAQIFVYNDQSLELKAGPMCVEVWGRGKPQDPVGLGPCNGGANQHWKMVESKDYYQIVVMNNQCLTLRNGVKDNGAALDIFDCNVAVPQRLWALVEAPPAADALGHVWNETECCGWSSVWTRRGGSNVFDVAYSRRDGAKVTSVNSVTIRGGTISVSRADSNGQHCNYTGTLNGVMVSGTYVCGNYGASHWQATIR